MLEVCFTLVFIKLLLAYGCFECNIFISGWVSNNVEQLVKLVGTVMNEIIEKLLKLKKWKGLNDVQKEAVNNGILDGKSNFVIIAPTASGKTGIAEIAMLQELENGGKAIYAVPSHALVDDKLKDFEYLTDAFKVQEGGSSYSQWVKADLIITTFELLYRACLMSKHFLNDFKLVVIDEFHVLYDNTRGYNLEKLLTILKESDSRTFCISATLENRTEIGEWLQAKIVYIPNEFRPIKISLDIIDLRKNCTNKQLCQTLMEKNNEPYLIFCSTKNFTKERAIEMCKLITKTKNDKIKLVNEIKRIISREELPELEEILCDCLVKGVGFHHSDLHNNLRNFVAELFRNRRIDYLFCTTGLAYGINFPARAVVIADLNLYNFEEDRSDSIPTYLYFQMAGRAGRPQYDDKGFCYISIKKDDDLIKFEKYKAGVLQRVASHIANNEYFFKAILELVYSKRDTNEEIISFFQNSLFNFQALRQEKGLIPYDLKKLIAARIKRLNDTGFLEFLGINYKLTDFGKVTLDYLFSGFSSPELSSFIRLNQYLEKTKTVKTDFDLIYFLSKTFPDCRISKQPYTKSKEVEEYLQNHGIADRTNTEYSAYVVYHKWIDNISETDIDKECKVYSSNLPSKMWEMYKLLGVYEELAKSKGYQVPQEFEILKERIRYGVREDELPLVKIHQIGREIARDIRRHCYNVLKANFGYSGTPIEILKTVRKTRRKGISKAHRHDPKHRRGQSKACIVICERQIRQENE